MGMNVIRDIEQDKLNDVAAPSMIPLFIDWRISRCNLKGCKNKPTTIVTNTGTRAFGMCEAHFQEAINTKGPYKVILEF
jgi:hypothetical protein